MACLVVTGCGYGPVGTTAYQYARALYSITNRRAEQKLDEVSNQIESHRAAGDLTDDEAGWLLAIVDDARAGHWEAANQASRRMLEDQIR